MNARAEVTVWTDEPLRQFYDLRLKVAQATRAEVLKALGDGLPRLAAVDGSYDGLVGLQHARVSRLINAHLTANYALQGAANALQEAMDWDEDEAMENGILWKVDL